MVAIESATAPDLPCCLPSLGMAECTTARWHWCKGRSVCAEVMNENEVPKYGTATAVACTVALAMAGSSTKLLPNVT